MVTVGKIMSKKVVTASEEDSVLDACRLLRDNKIGALIVISEKRAVGIISERDVIERVICDRKNPETTKVTEVMSRPLITIDSSSTVTEAAKLMSQKRIKKLGIVAQRKLVGVLTTSDIVKAAPEIYDEFIKQWVEPGWTD